jgi:peptidoglycan hydrolase CwlO-like protein
VAADAVVDLAIGVGGVVVGGLGTWAAVAQKFGDLTARVRALERVVDNGLKAIDVKIDDTKKDMEKQIDDRHQENQRWNEHFSQQLDKIDRQTDRRGEPRPI